MIERLELLKKRYEELNEELLNPEVLSDFSKQLKLSKEKSSIEPSVMKYDELKKVTAEIEDLKSLVNDPEMHEIASMELDEKHALLEKIEAAKQAGKEDDVKHLNEQLEYVEKSNERLNYLKDAIAKYEELIAKNEYDVIFGIRPEDIHDASVSEKQYPYSHKIDSEVQVAELLGHEYFIHTNYNNKDLISKIRSVNVLAKGDKIKLLLDLSKAHIFDRVSQDTIK